MREEVVHVELTLCHALGKAFGFLLLDILRCLFDKGDDIAHIQNAASHPCRIEFLQRVLLFADADQLDRAAGDLAHRQRGTATRITVKAGQHNAGDVDSLVEGSRRGHGVLTSHRIGDQQDLVRVGQRLYLAKLGHQPFINGDPAGRIEDQDIKPLKLGGLQGTLGNLRW